jgi:predicted enzyme related to lactoylglutathione lyase
MIDCTRDPFRLALNSLSENIIGDKQPGINGGLMKRMPGQPGCMINYIDVPSVDEQNGQMKTF